MIDDCTPYRRCAPDQTPGLTSKKPGLIRRLLRWVERTQPNQNPPPPPPRGPCSLPTGPSQNPSPARPPYPSPAIPPRRLEKSALPPRSSPPPEPVAVQRVQRWIDRGHTPPSQPPKPQSSSPSWSHSSTKRVQTNAVSPESRLAESR